MLRYLDWGCIIMSAMLTSSFTFLYLKFTLTKFSPNTAVRAACDTNRIISVCVATPKVAKASSVLYVACHRRWHYRAKLYQWKYGLKG